MTPGGRLSAAIEVLDRVLTGMPAEKALTNWGRASRYAGSGDRSAVRDLVYDALRCRRSFAALGGAMSGRGLVLGGVRAAGVDPATLFTGAHHAPSCLTGQDTGRAPSETEALDCPEWLSTDLQDSLGSDLAPVLAALRHRAPVFLRVNSARTTRAAAIAELATASIEARPHILASTALEVTGNARKIQKSSAYLSGLVELQDAASQAVVEALALRDGMRVLDLCAGGGGKTLAMAARATLQLFAHDAHPTRMTDLAARAARAAISVTMTDAPEAEAPFDLVLVDAPCSGSGSWRRDPEGKWALTPNALTAIEAVQAGILDRAARLTASGGVLAYVTCSVLKRENETQVAAFLGRHPGWSLHNELRFLPTDGGDGFYLAILSQSSPKFAQP